MRVAGPVGGGLGLLALVVISLLLGVDPSAVLEQTGGTSVQIDDGGAPAPQGPPSDELGQFVSVVLADTEDTWHELFADFGRPYEEPTLVLFTGLVRSACGMAQSAVGPFYCPSDGKVYIDLGFYRDLQQRFGAPGDFAQAYVIAHEVGHHVQMLLGISDRVHRAQSAAGQAEANALSVRMELQADCFAGVWAHHADRARALLEQGDIEEGLNAASAIGDDRLQRQAQGYVVPESFTHGSAEQRASWFARGLEAGDPDLCDTFNAPEL
jgi:predicted metalloprotease